MSMHDPTRGGKPRRLGLYLPFAALIAAVLVWSGVWLWASTQVSGGLDKARAQLAQAGYQLAWKTRQVGGYPFRLDVTLGGVSLREPGGWALQAPRIEAEAPAYAPGNWLVAAPDGLTFVRPEGGPVGVTGRLIRASLTHLTSRPPSFSFEGDDLAFRPAPGAAPFGLTGAGQVEFHLRAGPGDQGGVFATLAGGRPQSESLFARLAGGQPVAMSWNSTLSKMSAFSGADWPDALRRWSDAGGFMTVRDASLRSGDLLVEARSGTLRAGRDGRLEGVLDLKLRQAPRGLTAMAEAGLVPPQAADQASLVTRARQGGGDVADGDLHFEAGRTTLGPISLGPAPKVYDPR